MPTQSSHGFSVGDAIKHNGTEWSKAQADSASNAEVLAVVSAVADANNFTAVTSGLVSTLTGLTGGNLYYLSSSSAGALTTTEPTTNGTVSKPVLYAISSSSGYVLNHKGKTNAATVDSVNGSTGTVVLDADNIEDASTSHKFVTSDDLTTLSNTSGTNTGDQDLSTYQLKPSEGAFANGDKTRLDNMADNADVTNTTNVTNAGALMDSEVTNLAQVKAFDSSDYATAAQGSTADSALQSVAGDSNPTLGANLDLATYDIVTESSDRPIDLAPHGTGGVVLRGNTGSGSDTNTGKITFNCEANSHGVTIKAPIHSDISGAAGSYTLTLPDGDGDASQTLTTDGSGNLSWSTPAGSYGNSDVDTHLNTSSASTDQVLSWNGSDYAWTDQTGGGGAGGTSNRIISIDAGALVARTTNGAATATEEYATNDVMSDHFLFDGATEEGVQFRFHMPADWDGNAVNAKFYWDAATGASTSDGVTWGIAMQAFQDNDALDNAFGTSVDTDDAVIAVGDLHVTGLSSDITIAGSPSAGDLVIAEVTRVVGDANDTMTEDAKLVGVTIHYTATAATYDGQLGITIDGAGSAISTGSKGFLRVPYDCTITAAQILADQSGSIVIDVLKDTYANFPPTDPADSICASALPTLSSSQKSEDTTLTGWTTSVSKGDVLGFVVDSATTVTRVSLNLVVTKT